MPEAGGVKKKLIITRAEYSAGDQWLDVTEKVSAAVQNDCILQPVSLKSMGSDPAKGRTKRMKVTYTLGGDEVKTEVPEGQSMRVPVDGSSGYAVTARGTKGMTFVCAYSAGSLPEAPSTSAETKTANIHGGRNSNAASCSRNTSWPRCPPAVGRPPKTACWAATGGMAASTWK